MSPGKHEQSYRPRYVSLGVEANTLFYSFDFILYDLIILVLYPIDSLIVWSFMMLLAIFASAGYSH